MEGSNILFCKEPYHNLKGKLSIGYSFFFIRETANTVDNALNAFSKFM